MSKNRRLIFAIQYLILILVISVAAVLFQNTFENLNRFLIIVVVCLLYVTWGYWHHMIDERATFLVILEYALVSSIIILLSAMGLGVLRFF